MCIIRHNNAKVTLLGGYFTFFVYISTDKKDRGIILYYVVEHGKDLIFTAPMHFQCGNPPVRP